MYTQPDSGAEKRMRRGMDRQTEVRETTRSENIYTYLASLWLLADGDPASASATTPPHGTHHQP
jgi:hypothetical protein